MKRTTVCLLDDHTLLRQGVGALLVDVPDVEVVGDSPLAGVRPDDLARIGADVVVIGLANPDRERIGLTRLIRERRPASRVVIFAGYGDAEYLFRAFDAGAHGYVLKASPVAQLVSAIRAVHAGRRYVCDGMQRSKEALDDLGGDVSPLERMSAREREFLVLLGEGRDPPRIAEALDVSAKTVETYRSRVLRKLGLPDTASLVKFAIEHRLAAPV